jgi:hypothetical protein
LGTVANLGQVAARVLAEPVAEVRAKVQAQPTAYLDDMGWRLPALPATCDPPSGRWSGF